MLTLAAVRVLSDKTLAIKNCRVLRYIPDEGWYRQRREYPTYHVARCAEFELYTRELPEREYLVTSQLADDYSLLKIRPGGEVSLVQHGFVVCKHCLHSLRYKDYDEFRNRRRVYSQRVLRDFNLREFFRHYKQYPLSFGSIRHNEQFS